VCRGEPAKPIVLVAIVKVKTDRDHLIQNFDRWLDVLHTTLDAPGSKARQFCPGAHRYRKVLVARHPPVGFAGFVKEDRTDGPRLARHMRTRQIQKTRGGRQRRDRRHSEQPAPACTITFAHGRKQLGDFMCGKNGARNLETGTPDLTDGRTQNLFAVAFHGRERPGTRSVGIRVFNLTHSAP
jgi:hypothetical protein